MRMLVGVSVFAVPDLVRSCLKSLTGTPADVLVVNNCASPDVSSVVSQFPVSTIVNTENGYCNGGWNQTMQYGLERGYDIIGLGSSDVELFPGWYSILENRSSRFSNEVWLPDRNLNTTFQKK